MAVYLASVMGGNCVTKVNNNILNKKPTKNTNQLWTIEQKDGSANQIALRCNGDGNYLRAKAGNAYGAVETGAKQWWELEDGQAHGSYWLKCCDFPNAYLCNADGSYGEDNKIYMWPKQANWIRALTFYIQDAQARGLKSIGETGDNGESAKRLEDIKAKEAEVAKREAELAKLSEREKELSTKSSALEAKEKKLLAREREMQTQNDTLKKQLKAQGESASNASAEVLRKDIETLKKQQEELSQKSSALEEREKALAAKEKLLNEKGIQELAAGNSSTATGDSSSVDADHLAEENKRLATELASVKKEIAILQRSGVQVHSAGSTGQERPIPPPRLSRPALKRPEAKRPAPNLPGQFNQHLLERFEAGKTALKSK